MNFPSKLIQEAVEQFAKLPGLGRKTALRLVLNLLQMDKEEVNRFGQAFIDLRNHINYCSSYWLYSLLIRNYFCCFTFWDLIRKREAKRLL